jgi:acyl-CoA synthetase (AMP-forming)/AMP-acid ligase II
MMINVLENTKFKDFDVSSLRTGIMAGSTCPIALMHIVVDKLNMTEVTIGYVMTETSPLSVLPINTRLRHSLRIPWNKRFLQLAKCIRM